MFRYTERCEHTALRVGGLVFLAAVLLSAATPASGQLIPIVQPHWKIDVKPDAAAVVAGRHPYIDYLMIEDFQATSFELNRLGFGPILPSLGLDATGAITFTVNLRSGTQGTVDITGKMTSTTMSGTAKWTKDGKVYNYTFSGVPYTPDVDPES